MHSYEVWTVLYQSSEWFLSVNLGEDSAIIVIGYYTKLSVPLLIHLCIISQYTPNTNIDYKSKLNTLQECKKNLNRDWLTSERKLKIIFSSMVHIVQSNSYQNHGWTKCVIEISVLHQLSLFSFALLAFLLQGSMKCSRAGGQGRLDIHKGPITNESEHSYEQEYQQQAAN